MKRRKRTTTVTFETERVLIVGSNTGARCDMCGGRAALVALSEAARLAGVSERALYRGLEAEALHFIETADGQLLICLASLRQWTQAHGCQIREP
jgi:hypothetical protein